MITELVRDKKAEARSRSAAWYEEHKKDPDFVKMVNERSKANNRRYNKDPQKYARRLQSSREWKRRNMSRVLAMNSKRRAIHAKATPVWTDFAKMELIYNAARQQTETSGVLHHVDHIVPLISDIVCGLHVENNLQILPASLNRSKKNRFHDNHTS